ncbi:acetate--CoA ligase family protein [Variovorax sp. J22G21]|uniref:acetate--CoA ligase family protein n=1 Tax=Variovorax fucosicus TaxID=3053517 RepID=UPI0025791153|nr:MULTISPECIES: acetate--CoA ligase [unclassified Variovorax]MDM0042619.1 acetate--CoA ligase family protein [Variovorax sp. J22R193]MDM0061224.1 acetate--CoA ligase family protein [Variovorax sp. J22G21]
MNALHPIFYPDSIAVIGASKDQTKRGFRSIQKLVEDGFKGAIYPVNPKEASILGRVAYPSLAQIPGKVDLALICTPAKTLPDVIAQCGAKGVKGVVVLAGGFAEAGEEGRALQDRMVAEAKKHGVRIIGPNTSGIFNTHALANIVGFSHLKPGGIALLSQSGNMALSLVTEAQANGYVGLSTYVGIGNESDIRFHEYLEYLRGDKNTKAVIAYIEGMKDGRAFVDTLQRVTREKPVVIYKSGRTSAGRSSAQSHTGALAGDYAVSEGVLKQAGAILARKSDEILSLAEALSLLEPMVSRRVAVLADGGGHATIAADTLSERGLQIAPLSDSTKQALAAILPPSAAVANPVDVAGGTDSNPAVFADCARILLADPGVDALLITGLFGGYGVRFSQTLTEVEIETSERIATLHQEFGKPVLVHSLYGSLYADLRPKPLALIRERGIPVYDSLELAVRCLEALADFGEARRRPLPAIDTRRLRSKQFESVIAKCRHEGRTVVLEHEAREALESAGVDMLAPALVAGTPDEAVRAFHTLGGVPVAIKVVSRDIIHKTDAGGVKLGLADEAGVRKAFAEIVEGGTRYTRTHEGRDPDITGLLVTPMAPKGGIEIIIGVVRDPSYGPVLMFGLGGVLVEVLKDVVFRSLPLTEADARSMLGEIRAAQILEGVRGAKPTDKDALVKLMLGISQLCTAFPEIAELDLNPVLAYPQGVGILDARILLEDEASVAALAH